LALESSLRYRPDIDGLRAVAVLSVLLYHLRLPPSGGFVGVDIFFTISGFLIGSILLRETADRRFTFAGFYERRIRRICPALFVMMFVSSLVAYRYLLPPEFEDFAHSLLSAAFSFSNIYFWQSSGYFDAPAQGKPMLHTWSLAVEEQFYICLPIFLVLVRRFAPRRLDLSIYAVALISFAISIYGAFHYPTASFYLLHARAWELLLGTILALESCPRPTNQLTRNCAGIAGAALILFAMILYTDKTPFPGIAALPPCLGAALIIASGRNSSNLVGRLLSLKPVVFLGLISYSLYLWHWPVIVFASFGLTPLHALTRHQSQVELFGISMVLATLSWRFVEQPFRSGILRVNQRTLLTGAAAVLVLTTLASGIVIASAGAPWRFNAEAREIASYLNGDPHDSRDQYRRGTCFIFSGNETFSDFSMSTCLAQKPGEKSFLVLGDSHAAAMWWGFDQALPSVNVMQATSTGCKTVLHQRPRQLAACTELMQFIFDKYLPTHKVDAVLIEAHWDDGDLASLGETVEYLNRQNVPLFLFGPIVQYDSPLPRLLAMSISHKDPDLPRRHRQNGLDLLDREMDALARNVWHVPYISLISVLCSQNQCTQFVAPDVPLLSDYGHLTKMGSVFMAKKVITLGVLPLG
jgi:peptidoglycan/LPS O-acetylase OafA/YrhL